MDSEVISELLTLIQWTVIESFLHLNCGIKSSNLRLPSNSPHSSVVRSALAANLNRELRMVFKVLIRTRAVGHEN